MTKILDHPDATISCEPSALRQHAKWTRREWLATTALSATAPVVLASPAFAMRTRARRSVDGATAARVARHAHLADKDMMKELAKRAVDAARAAGAEYADARLTRTIQHVYNFDTIQGFFAYDIDMQGIGVRALINGSWGFASSPTWDKDDAKRLGEEAARLAKVNAPTNAQPIDLGRYPVATGDWTTPIAIDPFTVSIEEKGDFMEHWVELARKITVPIDTIRSFLMFARQERSVATSEGGLFHQTFYESGGRIAMGGSNAGELSFDLKGLDNAAKGWELFLTDAQIPEQISHANSDLLERLEFVQVAKPIQVGRYTIVCDGPTMALILDKTLGVATQLDRALGTEANATGTSFIDDPLEMVGKLQVTSPLVTVTANRSAPTQLATVKWDDEGVMPDDFTLVKDGIVTDFQTTRDQAEILAPYYRQKGMPVRSHGCAGAENALFLTMQHTPNLALTTSSSEKVGLNDLVANVPKGVLVTKGTVEMDFQARNGLLRGEMREIQNGRPGRLLREGGVLFNTQDFWKHIIAMGGRPSEGIYASSQYGTGDWLSHALYARTAKGQPAQMTGHTVRAVAAAIENQPLINPKWRA